MGKCGWILESTDGRVQDSLSFQAAPVQMGGDGLLLGVGIHGRIQ
jgi:hypothetical protein